MSDQDVVIRVEGVSKLYRLGEVGTGSLAHDVNRWWHKVRGKEDPYLKIGEVNDRTKPAARAVASSELRVAGEEAEVAGSELLVTSENQSAEGGDRAAGASGPATRHQTPATAPTGASAPATSYSPPATALKALPPLVTPKAPPSDWVYALKDVSFEVRKGEVLGIIGRNGAGNQAAGQPLGRLPKAARRGRRRGKARINSTLLKILSRVTQQTEGRISRVRAGDRSWKVADRCNQADGRPRGRLPQGSPKGEMSGSERINGQIASLLEVGTGFHPELTGRENIFLNGAILGMRKAEIARKFDEIVEFSGCARYIDTPVTQAAGRPLGRLPKAARRGRRAGASESTGIAPGCM